MKYEELLDKRVENDELHEEFGKCRERLENDVAEYFKNSEFDIIETRENMTLYHDHLNDYHPENNKYDTEYKLYDEVGYLYSTNCTDLEGLDELKAKNLKFYINKYLKSNKHKYKDFKINEVDKYEGYYLVELKYQSDYKKIIIDQNKNLIVDVVIKTDAYEDSYRKYITEEHENIESELSLNEYIYSKMLVNYGEYIEDYNSIEPITNHLIKKLLYFVVDGYVYTNNREYSTCLNHNKYHSRKLSNLFIDLANKATTMGDYCRNDNSSKNNFVSNALFKILRKGFKFNHRNSDKIFCYFTYVITRDFNETSKAQYKITNEKEISIDSLIGGSSVSEA